MKFWPKAFLLGLVAALSLTGSRAGEQLTPKAEKSEAKSVAPAEKLPSAEEILNRYEKAIGGSDVFKKHDSQHAIGTVEMAAQSLKGKLEVFAARPNKLLMKMSLPGIGDMNTGFDGKTGWMNNALLGPMLLQGKTLDQVAAQADFDQALHRFEDYKKAEVIGREEFNGEDCYKVHLLHRSGFDSTEFFSVKTGLQRGFIATQESPLGPITATTLVTEYKHFGDLYMPSRITQKAGGMETVMTIAEMDYDKVDPSVFELPAEIKTMLEKPAAKPESEPSAAKPGSTGTREKAGAK